MTEIDRRGKSRCMKFPILYGFFEALKCVQVSYWLIEASRKRGTIDLDMNNLYWDSIAVIIAGR